VRAVHKIAVLLLGVIFQPLLIATVNLWVNLRALKT